MNARFMKSMLIIIKEYKVDPSKICIIRECKKESNWRNSFYNEYKQNRNGMVTYDKNKYSVKDVFRNIYHNLFPKLEEKCGLHIIRIDKMEADDIIFMLARYLKKNNMNSNITVVSEDKDFAQFCDDMIKVVSTSFRELLDDDNITYSELMLKKVLLGDKSDNISSCIKTNINIQQQQLRSNNIHDLFKNLVESDSININKYNLNKQLILMKNIPHNLVWKAHDEFERIFNLPKIQKRMKYEIAESESSESLDSELLDSELLDSELLDSESNVISV